MLKNTLGVSGVLLLLLIQHACMKFTSRRAHLSSVAAPMHSMIDSIHEDVDDGRIPIAKEKLALLRRRLEEYIRGEGKTPEQFRYEVISLGPVDDPTPENDPKVPKHKTE